VIDPRACERCSNGWVWAAYAGRWTWCRRCNGTGIDPRITALEQTVAALLLLMRATSISPLVAATCRTPSAVTLEDMTPTRRAEPSGA
jgi:hypothetical protein